MMQSDTIVPGYALGDPVYIRGRVVAMIRDPFDANRPLLVCTPIDSTGKPLLREGCESHYYVSPAHAVNAATIKKETGR